MIAENVVQVRQPFAQRSELLRTEPADFACINPAQVFPQAVPAAREYRKRRRRQTPYRTHRDAPTRRPIARPIVDQTAMRTSNVTPAAPWVRPEREHGLSLSRQRPRQWLTMRYPSGIPRLGISLG